MMNYFKNIPLERRVMFEKYDFEKSKEVLFETSFLKDLEGCEVRKFENIRGAESSEFYIKNGLIFFDYDSQYGFINGDHVIWMRNDIPYADEFLEYFQKYMSILHKFRTTNYIPKIWQDIQKLL